MYYWALEHVLTKLDIWHICYIYYHVFHLSHRPFYRRAYLHFYVHLPEPSEDPNEIRNTNLLLKEHRHVLSSSHFHLFQGPHCLRQITHRKYLANCSPKENTISQTELTCIYKHVIASVLLTGETVADLKKRIILILIHIKYKLSLRFFKPPPIAVISCTSQIYRLHQMKASFYKTRNWSYWREPNLARTSIHTN